MDCVLDCYSIDLIFKLKEISSSRSVLTREMPVSTLKPQLSPSYLKPRLTDHQTSVLEKVFQWNKNPNESELAILAHETRLTLFDIKVWFENRWAEWRQEQGFPASSRFIHEIK